MVKAEGDAYIADESDPGKLKLRFSNCEYVYKSIHAADLRLCFRLCFKQVFS